MKKFHFEYYRYKQKGSQEFESLLQALLSIAHQYEDGQIYPLKLSYGKEVISKKEELVELCQLLIENILD